MQNVCFEWENEDVTYMVEANVGYSSLRESFFVDNLLISQDNDEVELDDDTHEALMSVILDQFKYNGGNSNE